MARVGLPVLLSSVLLLGFAPLAAADPPPILPLSEVKRGMKGYGKSVFSGTTIETFDVEVVDVLRKFLPGMDLILIRVSHPIVDRANVIGGMSGSPIYLEDKLVGALAYGWSFSKEPIAGVTPIEAILAEGKRPVRVGALDRNPLPPGIEPVTTPLIVSGVSTRGVRRLAEVFREHGLEPLQGGAGGEGNAPEIALEPGSAVGVTLVRGDLSMTATGTVTWVDGDTVYAFGHPFLNGGESRMPMTTAEVHMVLASVARSFKISSPVKDVGAMVQDRNACIVGRKGVVAPMIPVTVSLQDLDSGHESRFRYEVSRHPIFAALLINIVFAESIEAGENRMGDCTVTADWTVALEGQEPVRFREASAQSTQVYSINLLLELLRLHQNPLEAPVISRADVEVTVKAGNHSAEIERAWFDRERARPGETATLTVQLRKFRGDRVRREIEIPIPATHPEGTLEAIVSGRTEAPTDHPPLRTAQEWLRNLATRPPATAIVVSMPERSLALRVGGQVLPGMPNSALGAWVPSITEPADLAQEFRRRVEDTDWVISGNVRASLRIEK